ncbi:hypothetical protein SEA_IBANTIK_107 [Streptomyces phage Ibantik]|uniref:Uncharacterized protein n=1 Tax=Streptomyces phage Ibantik TaxID=2182397 RepID=A0A2U8UP17_9CAUD|nr:hypothetical protein QEH36_gp058 [Streptomyces phage Ibantik]AWN05328.1 hypothetical protein SEA_IBANTIK_107 [Streptomyces phage Ibantik]
MYCARSLIYGGFTVEFSRCSQRLTLYSPSQAFLRALSSGSASASRPPLPSDIEKTMGVHVSCQPGTQDLLGDFIHSCTGVVEGVQ